MDKKKPARFERSPRRETDKPLSLERGPRRDDRPAPRRDDRPAPRRDDRKPLSLERGPRRDDRPAPRRNSEKPNNENPIGLEGGSRTSQTSSPDNDRKLVRENHDEVKLYGVNACQTLARRRMDDIVRVYVTEERIKNFGHVLTWCAQNKRAYHVVSSEDMEKIAESVHHEGVCILAKARRMADFTTLVGTQRTATGPSCILFLENIGNSHNLGAILRVASHFGVTAVIVVSEDSVHKGMAPSVFRVAEGGAETVDVAFVSEAARSIRALKNAGYTIVATSSHTKDSLYASKLPERCVILFGSESNGLTPACLREADRRVAIPGTGNVESLNVSCASSTILGEFWRLNNP